MKNLKVNFKTLKSTDSTPGQYWCRKKAANHANIASEVGKKCNLGHKTQNGNVSMRRNSRATP